MTMFFPSSDFRFKETAEALAEQYQCSERATEEVLQYARVLCARGWPPEQLVMAIGRYARIRGQEDREWCF